MTLSEKIVLLRRRKNWSQEELAAQLDVARQSISKWESGQSLPELDKLVRMSEIFGVTLDSLVKDEEEIFDGDLGAPSSGEPGDPPAARRVSAEEASEFLSLRKKSSLFIALGVLLCIFSPICLLLLSAFAAEEGFALSENMAVLIGLIVLFLCIAPAVILFVISGLQGEKFTYLTNEDFRLDAATEAGLRAEKEDTRARTVTLCAVAVGLCILSPLPLLYAALVWQSSIPVMLGVVAVLVLAGLGAATFTFVGVRQGAYDILLREGEYNHKKSRLEEAVSSAYWMLTTAVYLTVSFLFENWDISWVIWVGAAILYGAVEALLRVFLPRNQADSE